MTASKQVVHCGIGFHSHILSGHPSKYYSLRHLLEKQQCSKNLAHLKLATSNADFTFRLYKQIMTEKDDRNVLFSPLTKISLDGHRGVEDL